MYVGPWIIFLINGYNGYICEVSKDALKKAMKRIAVLDSSELLKFSLRSKQLSKGIAPHLIAHSILSVMK